MQPNNNQKLTGGWKIIIASLSVTSIVGLVNLFSSKDVKTINSQVIDTILDKPIPTLVPVAGFSNPVLTTELSTPTSALREVTKIAPTSTPAKQTPVITVVGGKSSPTSTSSSKK